MILVSVRPGLGQNVRTKLSASISVPIVRRNGRCIYCTFYSAMSVCKMIYLIRFNMG